MVFRLLRPSGARRRRRRQGRDDRRGAGPPLGPGLAARWHDADREHDRPSPDALFRRQALGRGRAEAARDRPLQRHDRRWQGPRLCRQFRFRPPCRRGAKAGCTGPRRSRRLGAQGGRRAGVPQRHGDHTRRQDDDHRRDHGQAADGLRHRARRHFIEPPPVGRNAQLQSRRHLPRCRGRHLGDRRLFPSHGPRAGRRQGHARSRSRRARGLCLHLGGKDRRTLYVITNTGSGPAMADKRDGRIETMRVDVPGAGLP